MFQVETIVDNLPTINNMTLDEILECVYREIDEAEMMDVEYESTIFVKGIVHINERMLKQQVPDHVKAVLNNSDLQSGLIHLMDDYDQLVVTIKLDNLSLQTAIDYTKGE